MNILYECQQLRQHGDLDTVERRIVALIEQLAKGLSAGVGENRAPGSVPAPAGTISGGGGDSCCALIPPSPSSPDSTYDLGRSLP